MDTNNGNNKRIAKNTMFLFVRMLFSMVISLYTSRVVLNALGVEDFGIYNVVGGIVVMFSFLNSSMSSATQRFLTFELGKNDLDNLKRVFSMSINIHIAIALFITLLAETIGLWFLNNKLNIPVQRLNAANWVFQFSILTFVVSILSVPYNASIIAHEKMKAFAYIGLLDVFLRLLIAIALPLVLFDKLKIYAILIFCAALIIRVIYGVYCKRKFIECTYSFFWDKSLFDKLLSYAGWNLWGNLAFVGYTQGINILLNIFFGPVVNASRGIAYQVNGAVNSFVMNFQTAINPQIIKSYATNDFEYMHKLIFKGSKISFFLLLLLVFPVLLEAETILKIWLVKVPNYAVVFCQLILINSLIDSLSGALMTGVQATGRIKLYQSVIGGVLLLILPISYILLSYNFEPESTLYVSISVSIVALFLRLIIIKPLIHLSISRFVKEVLLKVLYVTIIAIPLPLLLVWKLEEGISRLFIVIIMALLMVLISAYLVGFDKNEKKDMKKMIFNK